MMYERKGEGGTWAFLLFKGLACVLSGICRSELLIADWMLTGRGAAIWSQKSMPRIPRFL